MAAEILKLTTGKNNRLYSITTRLSNICIKYLAFNRRPDLDLSEESVIEKGLQYLEDVRSGLNISKAFGQRTFSFDHKTIEYLDAFNQVFLLAESESEIETILDTVKQTLSAIKTKNQVTEESVKNSIRFFNDLSETVASDLYNPEASHIL